MKEEERETETKSNAKKERGDAVIFYLKCIKALM